MEWNNYCVTNAGVEALKKAIGGKRMTITAAKNGTETVAENLLKDQTELSGTVRNIAIANATIQTEGYRITLRVDNTGIKSSYVFKQLGIYARFEGESEFLFALLQSENGETVPDESELYTYDTSLIIAISDTSNITVNVDKTNYVTEEEMNIHLADNSNPHGVTKTQVGLGNVPNVDTNNQTPTYTVVAENAELESGEMISTAFGKIARAIISLISHLANKSNPHGVTKAQVGLGNVENTSDADKPVSTATSKAISSAVAKKADLEHKHTAAEVGAATADDVKAAVNAVEIGGTNLLLNTKSFESAVDADLNGALISGVTLISDSYRDFAVRSCVLSASVTELCRYNFTEFDLGDTFTFSFYAKGNISELRAFFYGDSGYVQVAKCINSQGEVSTNVDGRSSFSITEDWQRYWVTWKLKDTGNITVRKNVLLRTYGASAGQEVYVCGCMLEKSNKVSAWTPAPEDLAASKHTHTKSQITDFPTSLPANGGNASTVNNHTVDADVPYDAKFTDTQYAPFVKSGSGAKNGLVPAPSTTAGTSKYLCENGTWAVPPDTKYSVATTTSAGLLSASDKSKLDGIEAGADKYKLPVASETLGGVKTGPSVIVNSDGTMSIVKDSHYHSALEAIDITGKTIDLNTLNLSDAPGQIKHYVEKTVGGSANITNAPQAGMFLMIAKNIRWASSADFITEQVFVSVTTKKEYSRWCTSGTWSAWVERNYTNTWRGIQNNLTSDSATDSLSAAQGKALKALVDSKASSGHTHSYAGSSSVGGAATSADKINTDAGSATQPVYIKDGVPKATTYTLAKSVPASAVFTDTWKALVGSSTSAAGTAGYAPAPAKGATNRYLRCDGTWSVPPDTINNIIVKQGTTIDSAIDISSKNQAYIVFYKFSNSSSGTAISFTYPFIITDTTPETAISNKAIVSSSDIVILYSLTTDGKITFGGSGGYGYKILLFN